MFCRSSTCLCNNCCLCTSRCLSFYSLARSPKDGNVSSDVLESLLSVEEVLAEQESHSEDSVKAVPTDAVQVAVDH